MPPVTNHTIALAIDGNDRTGLLLKDSIFVRSGIGNAIDVAEFDLSDPSGSFTPADWDEVSITVDGSTLFGGYIVQREQDSTGVGNGKRAVWHVTCKDWSVLLDRVLVKKQYTLSDDTTIVADLFSTYLSGEGFDAATHVDNVRSDIDINFEEITLREALNDLAGRCNANWHIAPDKALYWYSPSAPAAAAFAISETPNNTTSFAPLEGTLKRSIDASQIINRVRVIGGEDTSTTLQTDTFAADGSLSTFGPLTKKPTLMWHVNYTVNTGGQDVSVNAYAGQIGFEPQDKLYVDGGTYSVLVNLENRTVKVTDINGLVPKAGSNVTVKYYYATPIEVTRNDTDSQTQFGRIFETSVYDENLSSPAEAIKYADAILDEYAFGRESVQFQVTRHGLLPGRAITITSTTMGLSGNYLIQEIQWTAVAVGQDRFMVVASVQCGKLVHTILDTLKPSFSAGAGRVPKPSVPGRIDRIAGDLGEIVAGRATFTDGGTARFEWGTPNGATGLVLGLETVEGNIYGANYIYEGGTVRAKLGRLTGLPNIGTITPEGWGLYTSNGYFSGRVVASQVHGGTITGGVLNGGNINQGTIAAAVIQGATITGGTITAPYINGGTVEGIALVGQTIEGAQIIGGTITSVLLESSFIEGGTIDMQHGSIGGFTIDGQLLFSNGGTIATGSVVNASNPGVYMSTAGLFGFGTLGMTFGLFTDPARAPFISSGTINNVVYEVYESGIIRTGSAVFTDGGLQMDNSGLFGVSPITGAASLLLENSDDLLLESGQGIEAYGLKFALDSVTGKIFAEDAYIQGVINARTGLFSGTVQSSYISGGTITGATIAGATVIGQTISGSDIVGGTITGIPIANAGITGGTISQNLRLGGTVSAAQIIGGTITGGVFTGGTVSQGTVSAAFINGGTISAATISGGTFSGGTTSGGTISAARINGGTISAATISGGTFSGGTVSQGTVSAAFINGGTISAATITGGNISGASLSGGTISGPDVRWARNGTVLARMWDRGAELGVPYVYIREDIGINAVSASYKETFVYSDPNEDGFIVQHASDGVRMFTLAGSSAFQKFTVGNDIEVWTNVIPKQYKTLTLGGPSDGFRYLYLRDSDTGANVWRVSVNTSGSLVVTKM